jgi:hypothetical protein
MNFRNSTSLSTAVLCVMATFAAGCADTEDKAPAEGTQKAAITSRGIAVNGCGGTALFDIMNNSVNLNQAINSVAIDQSAINNVTSQLWSVNSQNQLSQVTQQSQQVSANMATALSNFTNNTNAFQRATAWQSANASQFAAANTTTTISHFDSADTWNNATSAVFNQNSGFSSADTNAFNRAWGNQLAARNANSSVASSNFADSVNGFNSFQSNASFISNNMLGGFDAFGLAGFNAANISDVAANNAFATTRAASANNAFANTNVSDLARSGFLTSANTNTNQAASFFNSSRAVNQQANQASVANAATSTTTTAVADAANTSTNAMQDSMAAENSFNQASNAANSSNLMSQAQAFTNLNQVNSQNFVLQLNFTANSEQAFTNLFALNSNNNILTSNNFNFSFPGCGVGAVGIGGPVILPPADAPEAAAVTPSAIEVGPALARDEERE